MSLFDAHCHLQDELFADTLALDVEEARRRGVSQWHCCGVEEGDWDAVALLSRTCAGVLPSFGLHPWSVAERSPDWDRRLMSILRAHPTAGVGEIGLDHALTVRADADQLAVFETQFRMARELDRPVSVHCRRAWAALIESLTAHGPHRRGFVIHSYSGSAELIPQLASLGAYFSFSGSITFSHNRRGHRSAAAAPSERLLIETDAPALPPMKDGIAPGRGEINRPANLVRTLEAMAAIRAMPTGAVAELTRRNAERLFLGREREGGR